MVGRCEDCMYYMGYNTTIQFAEPRHLCFWRNMHIQGNAESCPPEHTCDKFSLAIKYKARGGCRTCAEAKGRMCLVWNRPQGSQPIGKERWRWERRHL